MKSGVNSEKSKPAVVEEVIMIVRRPTVFTWHPHITALLVTDNLWWRYQSGLITFDNITAMLAGFMGAMMA